MMTSDPHPLKKAQRI